MDVFIIILISNSIVSALTSQNIYSQLKNFLTFSHPSYLYLLISYFILLYIIVNKNKILLLRRFLYAFQCRWQVLFHNVQQTVRDLPSSSNSSSLFSAKFLSVAAGCLYGKGALGRLYTVKTSACWPVHCQDVSILFALFGAQAPKL